MPTIFRTLTSITAWVLFVFGVLALIGGFGRIIAGSPTIEMMTAYFGFGVGSMFLSAVTMKIRDMID